MSRIDRMFEDREVAEAAADRWWIFLLSGIAWFVFALLVFQWDFTTVYAVSILFGVGALFAGVNEFFQISGLDHRLEVRARDPGSALRPRRAGAPVLHNAFATIAGLIGYFFLFKGIFDFTVAILARGNSSSGGSR